MFPVRFQGRSDHIRTYARALLKVLKQYFLFCLFLYLTYLFIYRFFGEVIFFLFLRGPQIWPDLTAAWNAVFPVRTYLWVHVQGARFSWHLSGKWIKWPRVNEAEVPFWKFNQVIFKRFFSLLEFSIYEKRMSFFVVLKVCLKKKNTILVDRTLHHTSPQFYPGVYVAFVTLLTYPVSTCAANAVLAAWRDWKPLFEVLWVRRGYPLWQYST